VAAVGSDLTVGFSYARYPSGQNCIDRRYSLTKVSIPVTLCPDGVYDEPLEACRQTIACVSLGRRKMTCCIAALCDERESIILVADRMVGTGMIEGEPDIKKVFALHKHWRVMLAGNDISPAFPIIDSVRQKLTLHRGRLTVQHVMDAVYGSYRDEREVLAEAVHLAPRGWTTKRFNSPAAQIIPESLREVISDSLHDQRLEVTLLVSGFDGFGKGHVFSVSDDYQTRGKPQRHDIPGFQAIGSGGPGAMYMMMYREVSPSMPLRLALYYAIEGKYFGEQAAAVGTDTDAYIMRAGENVFRIKLEVLNDYLFKLCEKLKPRDLNQSDIGRLNSLPGKLIRSVPKLQRVKEGKEWVIREESSGKAERADPSD